MRKLIDLFRPQGAIGPGAYLLTGALAFALKYWVDRLAAALLMHQPWMPWQYLSPLFTTVGLIALGPSERRFLLVMSAIALPFIWLGITVTMKRLRSLGLPLWLVVLFFIPAINFAFFLALCLVPAGRPRAFAPQAASNAGWKRDGALALAASTLVCVAAAWLGTKLLGRYGWGLFVALPFCMGLISTVIFTWHAPRRYGDCIAVAMLTTVVAAAGLLVFGMEGLSVC